MIKAIAAFGGSAHLRSFSVVVACALLSACNLVKEVEVHRVSASAPRVSALQVRFEPVKVVSTRNVYMGISSAPLAYTDPGITLNVANMNRIFGQGFSERFPEMAKGYGLTVSPTAPAILTVTMTSGLSKCPSWCATTFQVEGVLKDLGGNLMWTMSAKVTIGSYDKTGTEHVGLAFDQLAHEWLEAMKKQGVIG